jgi:ribosomal protein S18 acetylase RimI-like enzyme
MNMDVNILKAESKDASEINYILKSAFKESFEKYGFCPAYEAEDSQISAWIIDSVAYKILVNGQLQGAVFVVEKNKQESELSIIAINPEFQNMGIASKAIILVEQQHTSTKIWTLQTPEKETGNVHLYEKLGYVKVGNEKVNEYLNLVNYRKEL